MQPIPIFKSRASNGVKFGFIVITLVWTFSFLRRPLKHSGQRGDLKLLMELTFKRKILNCIDELLKVFLYSPPPLKEKVFFGLLNQRYQK
jgi:hypothetical protein